MYKDAFTILTHKNDNWTYNTAPIVFSQWWFGTNPHLIECGGAHGTYQRLLVWSCIAEKEVGLTSCELDDPFAYSTRNTDAILLISYLVFRGFELALI